MSNPIIDNIRRSLGHGTSKDGAQMLTGPRPEIYASRRPEAVQTEVESFLEEVRKLSGTAQRFSALEVSQALSELVAQQNVRKATLWQTAFLKELGIEDTLRGLGVELVSPDAEKHDLSLCELGVTEADFLLPETGTLVLRSSAEKPRAISLLPRVHLAIVRPERLRPDLHQVFAEAKDSPYLVFITGPSRTADIELTTTLGVHGPKTLIVWMVDEA